MICWVKVVVGGGWGCEHSFILKIVKHLIFPFLTGCTDTLILITFKWCASAVKIKPKVDSVKKWKKSILHACMAKLGSMDIGTLHFWCLDHTCISCEQMLILGQVDKTLFISPFDDIWTIKNLFSHDLHIYLIICMKKITIYIFKNSTSCSKTFREKTCLKHRSSWVFAVQMELVKSLINQIE